MQDGDGPGLWHQLLQSCRWVLANGLDVEFTVYTPISSAAAAIASDTN